MPFAYTLKHFNLSIIFHKLTTYNKAKPNKNSLHREKSEGTVLEETTLKFLIPVDPIVFLKLPLSLGTIF